MCLEAGSEQKTEKEENRVWCQREAGAIGLSGHGTPDIVF